MRRQLLIGGQTYLNGRSQTIRWRPGTRAGLLIDREIWARPAPADARLADVLHEAAGAGWWQPTVSAFPPGLMPGTSLPVLSREAATAARQLSADSPASRPKLSGPDDLVRAALDVAGVQYLDGWQRAALLEVLADVPGVVLDGARSDLAGRRGLAFRFVGSPNLLTVIIDRRTGEILAANRVLRDLDEAVLFTTLYLDRGRCAGTWQTAGPDSRRGSSCCGGAR